MKELNTWEEVVQAILNGEKLEYYSESFKVWKELQYLPVIPINALNSRHSNNYRIKPKTILIGSMEVPEPVQDASEFEEGETYYIPITGSRDFYGSYRWGDDSAELRLLKRGLIHKTRDNAIIHAKALIKISGGSCD